MCCGYVLDLLCYIAFVQLGVHLYVAYVAAFVAGTVCNVVLLRRYLRSIRHAFVADVAMTLAANGVLFVLMMGLYIALMKLAGMHHLYAKIASNGVSFVINYLTRRLYF